MLTPLRAYLDATYAGRDAEEAAEDLAKIAAMRCDVVANAVATSDARRDLLVRCARAARPLRSPQRPALPPARGAPLEAVRLVNPMP